MAYVGTQAQFRKKKPPVTYRYGSSLSPALDWDGQNGAREPGEWLLACIQDAARLQPPHRFPEPRQSRGGDGQVLVTVSGLHDAVEQLKRLGKPFLDWAGKAERLSFDVPTLPLFVHERLSTQAIIATFKSHRKTPLVNQMALFADPQHPVSDQVLTCAIACQELPPAPRMEAWWTRAVASGIRHGFSWASFGRPGGAAFSRPRGQRRAHRRAAGACSRDCALTP